MIKLSPGLNSMSDEFKGECLETFRCILPNEFQYVVNDFTLIEESIVVGEAKFKSKFRVNVTGESGIKPFIQSLVDKSGTSYNTQRGDVKGTGKKVVVHGSRKCIYNVRRHHMKMKAPHEGPGRQPECVPGKNTECPAKLNFTLSGSSLHTSNRKRMSLTRMQKDQYPLDIELEFVHNHAINSADALRYRPVTEEVKT